MQISGHQEPVNALYCDCTESAIEFTGIACWDGNKGEAQHLGRGLRFRELGGMGGIIGIPEKGHPFERGQHLLEKLQSFAGDCPGRGWYYR